MGEVVQFVPRNAVTGKPMLEQIATEAVESITEPMYESSLGMVPAGMSPCEWAEMWAAKHSPEPEGAA